MRTRVVRRPAFTLMELIIVIGIIVILATLAAMFLPNLDRNKGVPNAVTQLHGWVHLSRMQAIRDGTGKGVRLYDDGGGVVTSLQYIEQPEPIAPRGPGIRIDMHVMPCSDPVLFPNSPGNVGPLTVVTLYQDPGGTYMGLPTPPPDQNPTPWLDWGGPNGLGVQQGDYFQLTGSPTAFAAIRSFSAPTRSASHPFAELVLDRIIDGTEATNGLQCADNFRVIRQPRPLIGEPMLQLHKDVYIDLTRSHPCPPYLAQVFPAKFQASTAWSPNTDPTTGQAYLDILFNSNGTVANAPYGQVFLWVQHRERTNDNLLLSIYTRTGKIAPYSVFDLDFNNYDPYSIARAGQTPGL